MSTCQFRCFLLLISVCASDLRTPLKYYHLQCIIHCVVVRLYSLTVKMKISDKSTISCPVSFSRIGFKFSTWQSGVGLAEQSDSQVFFYHTAEISSLIAVSYIIRISIRSK